MTEVLLAALFATSGLFALATMASSVRRHGRAALALRDELAVCGQRREVRVRVAEVAVHATATVLRPDFTAGRRPSRPALPAAA
jgi:hypothetical protein